jgi:hypothetical protein
VKDVHRRIGGIFQTLQIGCCELSERVKRRISRRGNIVIPSAVAGANSVRFNPSFAGFASSSRCFRFALRRTDAIAIAALI